MEFCSKYAYDYGFQGSDEESLSENEETNQATTSEEIKIEQASDVTFSNKLVTQNSEIKSTLESPSKISTDRKCLIASIDISESKDSIFLSKRPKVESQNRNLSTPSDVEVECKQSLGFIKKQEPEKKLESVSSSDSIKHAVRQKANYPILDISDKNDKNFYNIAQRQNKPTSTENTNQATTSEEIKIENMEFCSKYAYKYGFQGSDEESLSENEETNQATTSEEIKIEQASDVTFSNKLVTQNSEIKSTLESPSKISTDRKCLIASIDISESKDSIFLSKRPKVESQNRNLSTPSDVEVECKQSLGFIKKQEPEKKLESVSSSDSIKHAVRQKANYPILDISDKNDKNFYNIAQRQNKPTSTENTNQATTSEEIKIENMEFCSKYAYKYGFQGSDEESLSENEETNQATTSEEIKIEQASDVTFSNKLVTQNSEIKSTLESPSKISTDRKCLIASIDISESKDSIFLSKRPKVESQNRNLSTPSDVEVECKQSLGFIKKQEPEKKLESVSSSDSIKHAVRQKANYPILDISDKNDKNFYNIAQRQNKPTSTENTNQATTSEEIKIENMEFCSKYAYKYGFQGSDEESLSENEETNQATTSEEIKIEQASDVTFSNKLVTQNSEIKSTLESPSKISTDRKCLIASIDISESKDSIFLSKRPKVESQNRNLSTPSDVEVECKQSLGFIKKQEPEKKLESVSSSDSIKHAVRQKANYPILDISDKNDKNFYNIAQRQNKPTSTENTNQATTSEEIKIENMEFCSKYAYKYGFQGSDEESLSENEETNQATTSEEIKIEQASDVTFSNKLVTQNSEIKSTLESPSKISTDRKCLIASIDISESKDSIFLSKRPKVESQNRNLSTPSDVEVECKQSLGFIKKQEPEKKLESVSSSDSIKHAVRQKANYPILDISDKNDKNFYNIAQRQNKPTSTENTNQATTSEEIKIENMEFCSKYAYKYGFQGSDEESLSENEETNQATTSEEIKIEQASDVTFSNKLVTQNSEIKSTLESPSKISTDRKCLIASIDISESKDSIFLSKRPKVESQNRNLSTPSDVEVECKQSLGFIKKQEPEKKLESVSSSDSIKHAVRQKANYPILDISDKNDKNFYNIAQRQNKPTSTENTNQATTSEEIKIENMEFCSKYAYKYGFQGSDEESLSENEETNQATTSEEIKIEQASDVTFSNKLVTQNSEIKSTLESPSKISTDRKCLIASIDISESKDSIFLSKRPKVESQNRNLSTPSDVEVECKQSLGFIKKQEPEKKLESVSSSDSIKHAVRQKANYPILDISDKNDKNFYNIAQRQNKPTSTENTNQATTSEEIKIENMEFCSKYAYKYGFQGSDEESLSENEETNQATTSEEIKIEQASDVTFSNKLVTQNSEIKSTLESPSKISTDRKCLIASIDISESKDSIFLSKRPKVESQNRNLSTPSDVEVECKQSLGFIKKQEPEKKLESVSSSDSIKHAVRQKANYPILDISDKNDKNFYNIAQRQNKPTSTENTNQATTSEEIKKPKRFRKADSNIIGVKFDKLVFSNEKFAGEAIKCKNCDAIMSDISRINLIQEKNIWNCEFCFQQNDLSKLIRSLDEIPKASDVTFLIKSVTLNSGIKSGSQFTSNSSNDNSYLIYCIDISGSMDTAIQVKEPGVEGQNPNLSRLSGVKVACSKSLSFIKKQEPEKRVALVLFSNNIKYYGDGTKMRNGPILDISGQNGNFFYNYANTKENMIDLAQNQDGNLEPIKKTYNYFDQTLKSLMAGGGTALGPALAFSIGFSSKQAGSQIILCTDGCANVGMGSVEFGDQAKAEKFYEDLADYAKSKGVTVNVISMEGTDCKLALLGKVADRSNGIINIVNPLNLSDEFESIIENKIVATEVKAKLIVNNKYLYIRSIELETAEAEAYSNDNQKAIEELNKLKTSTLVIDVGNANLDTEITFEYGIKKLEENERKNAAPLKELPFQLQISYTLPDGTKALRVYTKLQQFTQDRIIAEKNIESKELIWSHYSQKISSHVTNSNVGAAQYRSHQLERFNKINNWEVPEFISKNLNSVQAMSKSSRYESFSDQQANQFLKAKKMNRKLFSK